MKAQVAESRELMIKQRKKFKGPVFIHRFGS